MQQQISSWQIQPEIQGPSKHLDLLKARRIGQCQGTLGEALEFGWSKSSARGGVEVFSAEIFLWKPLNSGRFRQILADSGRFWQHRAAGTEQSPGWEPDHSCRNIFVPVPFASLVSYKFSVKSFVPHLLESCMGRRISLTLFVNLEFPVPGIFTVGSTMKSSFSRIWPSRTDHSQRDSFIAFAVPHITLFSSWLARAWNQGLRQGSGLVFHSHNTLCVHLGSAEQQQPRLRFVHSSSGVQLKADCFTAQSKYTDSY